MKTIESRKFKVVDENGISIRFFDTKKEADKEAKRMTQYHKREFKVETI